MDVLNIILGAGFPAIQMMVTVIAHAVPFGQNLLINLRMIMHVFAQTKKTGFGIKFF